jgi:hypothetical protein
MSGEREKHAAFAPLTRHSAVKNSKGGYGGFAVAVTSQAKANPPQML